MSDSASSFAFSRCSQSSRFTRLKSCSMPESLAELQTYSAKTMSRLDAGCLFRAALDDELASAYCHAAALVQLVNSKWIEALLA
jgi:hypothetical protein